MKYMPCEFVLPSGLALKGFASTPSTASSQGMLNPLASSNKQGIVLCLHGWLDNAASFMPLWDTLFDDEEQHPEYVSLKEQQWYSIDFPGHGESDHRGADAAYHHTDYILDIAALIETQGWENVTLLGHSMGGIVGASVCALLPQRIQRFISIEALGPLVEDTAMTVKQMRKALQSRIEQAQKTIKQPDSLTRVVAAKMHAGKLSEAHAQLIMQRNLRKAQGGYTWGTDPKLRTVSTFRMTTEQAQDIMHNIQCPVLFIKGDSGFVRIAEQYAQRKSWLACEHRLLTLTGNHYVHMQAPKELLTEIAAFVSR